MRTLVVSSSHADPVTTRLSGLLRTLVDNLGPAKAMFDTAENALFQGPPDMVAVVLSGDVERGLEVMRRLRRGTSRPLLAVGPSDSKLILRALHQGADHYLDEEELETGLEAVLSRFGAKDEIGTPSGRFVAVLASSGGCGASTLAVNLATVLAREHGKCALVDLKPGRGDLAALLDLKPQFHLADVCRNSGRLDRAMFEKMLIAHDCGVHLLGSPPTFGDARAVTSAGVNLALTMARKLFDHVVADLEDCFHEEQMIALRQATGILLVSRLDFTALRNARKVLDHLNVLGVPRHCVRIVINRYGQPSELPISEAEEALGERLTSLVPEDSRTFNAANNTGIPAVLKYPKSRVSQCIADLAKFAIERRRAEAAVLVNGAAS